MGIWFRHGVDRVPRLYFNPGFFVRLTQFLKGDLRE
jgi:hypothetical protein